MQHLTQGIKGRVLFVLPEHPICDQPVALQPFALTQPLEYLPLFAETVGWRRFTFCVQLIQGGVVQ